MTANINNTEATATVNAGGVITLKVDGQSLTLTAEQATSVVTALLAGRKAAYSVARDSRVAAREAKRAEHAAKKAERVAKAEAKKAATLKRLEAKLAELKKAA